MVPSASPFFEGAFHLCGMERFVELMGNITTTQVEECEERSIDEVSEGRSAHCCRSAMARVVQNNTRAHTQ